MTSSYARNAIVLGLLAAVGPFAIDMYLPALPTIAADLGATTAATQMTLTLFFVGFGLSQLAYGPITDMVGRKPPLYFGLALFLLGSVGCGLAQSISGSVCSCSARSVAALRRASSG
jgi:MFS transporter, DHA1 family, multidrug resistance protein